MGILGGARDEDKQAGYIVNMDNAFAKQALKIMDTLRMR